MRRVIVVILLLGLTAVSYVIGISAYRVESERRVEWNPRAAATFPAAGQFRLCLSPTVLPGDYSYKRLHPPPKQEITLFAIPAWVPVVLFGAHPALLLYRALRRVHNQSRPRLFALVCLGIAFLFSTVVIDGSVFGVSLRPEHTLVANPRDGAIEFAYLRPSPNVVPGRQFELGPFVMYSGAELPIRGCFRLLPRTVSSDTHLHHKWSLSVPKWVIFLLVGFYPVLVFPWELVRRSRRLKKKCCLECGYDLTGNVSGRCPECGRMVAKDLEREADRE